MAASRASLQQTLAAGIDKIGLALDARTQERLLDYVVQLHKWNQAFNLSGIKQLDDMVTLHLLDSLVLAPYIDGERIADVGTGAGLPGFPLALCYPDKQFLLIESNSKKTRFIFQTAAMLDVHNIMAIHCRVEDYASQPQVDIVTSRAFASLADFVKGCRHLVSGSGKFLAMKGLYPKAEIDELPRDFQVSAVYPVKVPGVAAERHILEIRHV